MKRKKLHVLRKDTDCKQGFVLLSCLPLVAGVFLCLSLLFPQSQKRSNSNAESLSFYVCYPLSSSHSWIPTFLCTVISYVNIRFLPFLFVCMTFLLIFEWSLSLKHTFFLFFFSLFCLLLTPFHFFLCGNFYMLSFSTFSNWYTNSAE